MTRFLALLLSVNLIFAPSSFGLRPTEIAESPRSLAVLGDALRQPSGAEGLEELAGLPKKDHVVSLFDAMATQRGFNVTDHRSWLTFADQFRANPRPVTLLEGRDVRVMVSPRPEDRLLPRVSITFEPGTWDATLVQHLFRTGTTRQEELVSRGGLTASPRVNIFQRESAYNYQAATSFWSSSTFKLIQNEVTGQLTLYMPFTGSNEMVNALPAFLYAAGYFMTDSTRILVTGPASSERPTPIALENPINVGAQARAAMQDNNAPRLLTGSFVVNETPDPLVIQDAVIQPDALNRFPVFAAFLQPEEAWTEMFRSFLREGISNAIQGRTGGEQVRPDILLEFATGAKQMIFVSVVDTGDGIQGDLSQPDVVRQGTTGLGIRQIIYPFAQQIGGQVRYLSHQKESSGTPGTALTLSLPVVQQVVSTGNSTAATDSVRQTDPGRTGLEELAEQLFEPYLGAVVENAGPLKPRVDAIKERLRTFPEPILRWVLPLQEGLLETAQQTGGWEPFLTSLEQNLGTALGRLAEVRERFSDENLNTVMDAMEAYSGEQSSVDRDALTRRSITLGYEVVVAYLSGGQGITLDLISEYQERFFVHRNDPTALIGSLRGYAQPTDFHNRIRTTLSTVLDYPAEDILYVPESAVLFDHFFNRTPSGGLYRELRSNDGARVGSFAIATIENEPLVDLVTGVHEVLHAKDTPEFNHMAERHAFIVFALEGVQVFREQSTILSFADQEVEGGLTAVEVEALFDEAYASPTYWDFAGSGGAIPPKPADHATRVEDVLLNSPMHAAYRPYTYMVQQLQDRFGLGADDFQAFFTGGYNHVRDTWSLKLTQARFDGLASFFEVWYFARNIRERRTPPSTAVRVAWNTLIDSDEVTRDHTDRLLAFVTALNETLADHEGRVADIDVSELLPEPAVSTALSEIADGYVAETIDSETLPQRLAAWKTDVNNAGVAVRSLDAATQQLLRELEQSGRSTRLDEGLEEVPAEMMATIMDGLKDGPGAIRSVYETIGDILIGIGVSRSGRYQFSETQAQEVLDRLLALQVGLHLNVRADAESLLASFTLRFPDLNYGDVVRNSLSNATLAYTSGALRAEGYELRRLASTALGHWSRAGMLPRSGVGLDADFVQNAFEAIYVARSREDSQLGTYRDAMRAFLENPEVRPHVAVYIPHLVQNSEIEILRLMAEHDDLQPYIAFYIGELAQRETGFDTPTRAWFRDLREEGEVSPVLMLGFLVAYLDTHVHRQYMQDIAEAGLLPERLARAVLNLAPEEQAPERSTVDRIVSEIVADAEAERAAATPWAEHETANVTVQVDADLLGLLDVEGIQGQPFELQNGYDLLAALEFAQRVAGNPFREGTATSFTALSGLLQGTLELTVAEGYEQPRVVGLNEPFPEGATVGIRIAQADAAERAGGMPVLADMNRNIQPIRIPAELPPPALARTPHYNRLVLDGVEAGYPTYSVFELRQVAGALNATVLNAQGLGDWLRRANEIGQINAMGSDPMGLNEVLYWLLEDEAYLAVDAEPPPADSNEPHSPSISVGTQRMLWARLAAVRHILEALHVQPDHRSPTEPNDFAHNPAWAQQVVDAVRAESADARPTVASELEISPAEVTTLTFRTAVLIGAGIRGAANARPDAPAVRGVWRVRVVPASGMGLEERYNKTGLRQTVGVLSATVLRAETLDAWYHSANDIGPFTAFSREPMDAGEIAEWLLGPDAADDMYYLDERGTELYSRLVLAHAIAEDLEVGPGTAAGPSAAELGLRDGVPAALESVANDVADAVDNAQLRDIEAADATPNANGFVHNPVWAYDVMRVAETTYAQPGLFQAIDPTEVTALAIRTAALIGAPIRPVGETDGVALPRRMANPPTIRGGSLLDKLTGDDATGPASGRFTNEDLGLEEGDSEQRSAVVQDTFTGISVEIPVEGLPVSGYTYGIGGIVPDVLINAGLVEAGENRLLVPAATMQGNQQVYVQAGLLSADVLSTLRAQGVAVTEFLLSDIPEPDTTQENVFIAAVQYDSQTEVRLGGYGVLVNLYGSKPDGRPNTVSALATLIQVAGRNGGVLRVNAIYADDVSGILSIDLFA